jgi:hypothetical protein
MAQSDRHRGNSEKTYADKVCEEEKKKMEVKKSLDSGPASGGSSGSGGGGGIDRGTELPDRPRHDESAWATDSSHGGKPAESSRQSSGQRDQHLSDKQPGA